MARPKSENPKVKQYRLRLTDEEYEKIKSLADCKGIAISELLRKCVAFYEKSNTWEQIHKLIDDAVTKRDRSVSLYFNPSTGMSVSVYPWPDAEDLYEMYKDGKITANDFREKMGLPRVKNPEQFMKRSFLDKKLQIPEE